MITKIIRIKDFGVFKNFNGTALSEFKVLNLIYGWNYSGKTTLSRVFRCLEKGKLHDDYKAASFELSHTSGKYDNTFATVVNIRVFNSDFIKENLKWDADKIEPILLLGAENIELQKKLETASQKLEATQERLASSKHDKDEKEKKLKKTLTEKAKGIATLLSLRSFDRDHLIKLLEQSQPGHMLSPEPLEAFRIRAISMDQKPPINPINLAISGIEDQKNQVEQLLAKQVSSTSQIQKLLTQISASG